MKITSLLTGLVYLPRQIATWYYIKLLHLRTGDELAEINLEFK